MVLVGAAVLRYVHKNRDSGAGCSGGCCQNPRKGKCE
ncbi:hypothetical protein [Magnetospirillum moscoviense]